MWSGDEGLRKPDHGEKASCGLEMKEWKKQTTGFDSRVVWKRRNWKTGPQRKSKLWSGNEVIGKTDHNADKIKKYVDKKDFNGMI